MLGTVLMVDLSLLGRGIARYPVGRIAQELGNWTLAGLALMLTSGPLLLVSEAVRCYKTPAFWIKMALLAAALVFYFTIHRKAVAHADVSRRGVRGAAIVSLALWTGVALAGKAIAIEVVGAASERDAETVGRAVARSALLKCAIAGQDPNWGRVLAAVGTAATLVPAYRALRIDPVSALRTD